MGRPTQSSPLEKYSSSIKEELIKLRQRGDIPIGAKTILAKLKADPRFANHQLPSARSIGRYLKHEGLSRNYNQRQPFEISDLPKTSYSHERWQMDTKGAVHLQPLGFMAMINIKDEFSRVGCVAYPTLRKQLRGVPSRKDYQNALRLAFMNFGLPNQIQTDHESTFFENKGNSAFPTVFHMWLAAMGIELVFSRFGRPTDQGMIERTHQTVNNLIQRQDYYTTWNQLFQACERERHFLNHHLPLPGKKRLASLPTMPSAKHSGQHYNPAIEERLLNLDHVYKMLEGAKWYRALSKSKTFHLGGYPYYVKSAKKEKQVSISFCSCDKMLYIKNEHDRLLEKHPVQGITKQILMGQLYQIRANIQLEFSFDVRQPDVVRLFGT